MATPNTTLKTVADYLTDARVLLQDRVVPYRYDDESLITALNVTLSECYRVRPDLFICYNGIVPTFTTSDTGAVVNLEQQFRLPQVYGMCAHAFARDQEDIQDNRYDKFMGTFYDLLIGSRARPLVSGAPPTQGGR